jgi:hypothetical protein
MRSLQLSEAAACGRPGIDSQEPKYFTKFPQTAKFMKWEIEGNGFSLAIQKLSQAVAIAAAVIFDLIALPFRAALFFSFGLCANKITIARNPPPEKISSPISVDRDSSSSSGESDISSSSSSKTVMTLVPFAAHNQVMTLRISPHLKKSKSLY